MDETTPLPSWELIPGVASVDDAEVRELDARYFDTADLDLAHAGYALRRRSGGPDAGWHIKGPDVGGGREERHWPLGASDDEPPPAALVAHLSMPVDAALLPLARIRNRRTAYSLRDGRGGVIAEFVDDRVRAKDERSAAERSWREWEFELGSAAPEGAAERAAIFTAVEAAVHAAGGRDAASASKLARTLGF